MKRSMIRTIAVCLFTLTAMAVATQAQTPEAEKIAIFQKQLILEIRSLRLEVIQQGIEFRTWKIQQLERELRQVRDEQENLEEEERALNQQIVTLSNTAALEADRAKDLEAIKADLVGNDLRKLQAGQQKIAQQAAEMTEQLKQEQQRLQDLLQKAKKLKAEN